MCFSVQSSVFAAVLGWSAAWYAFRTRQPLLGSLIAVYSLMQVSEALVWWGIDTSQPALNRLGGYIGKYSLPAHNLALGLGVLLCARYVHHRAPTPSEYIPLLVGALVYAAVMIFSYDHGTIPLTLPQDLSCPTRSCQNPHNRLQWPYDTTWYAVAFAIYLGLSFCYVQPSASFWLTATFYTLTFLVLVLYLQWDNGSVWCFGVALLAPLLVVANARLTRSVPSRQLWT